MPPLKLALRITIIAALTIAFTGAAPAGARPVVVNGKTYDGWTEYFRSTEFGEGGLRCGTHEPNFDLGTSALLGGPADCALAQTNPLAEYEPDESCEIVVVVHRLESATGDGVFADALVQSQIDVLNEDFQALAGTNGSAGYNSRIRFRLATFDPDNNPTPGWTRTTNEFWFNDLPDPVLGTYYDHLAWDPHRYLNIYTLSPEAPGGLILGYVPFFPQEGGVGTAEDGVRCLWSAFGRPGTATPYDQGRTVTHEVGHHLGLYHTFQSGCGTAAAPGCYSSGDRICDTEAESASRGGCPAGATSCSSPDPIHNYMDYTDDLCMNQFTHEQVRRIICTMRYYRPLLCAPDQPTATVVHRFAASMLGPGEVELAWLASVDTDITGWNVYRGTDEYAPDRVNPAPIEANGLGSFRVTDTPGMRGTLYYRLTGLGRDGIERNYGLTQLAVDAPAAAFAASIAGPNPARGPVTIAYALPEAADVRVEVFSLLGQRVRTLASGMRAAGSHTATFSLRDGDPLAPGIYMVRVVAGEHRRSLRVVALE